MSPDPEQRKKWLYGGLALLVLLVLAFIGGRFSAPSSTMEQASSEKTEARKEAEETSTKVDRVEVKEKATALRRVRTEAFRPDGTLERRETITTRDTQATATTGQVATVEAKRAQETITASKASSSKMVTLERARWRLDAGVGLNVLELARPTPVFVLGGGVRLFGPIWLGLTLSTAGQAAVTGGIQW